MSSATQAATLSIDGLTIENPSNEILLRDASLELFPGEVVVLSGPSGSGKSTLFDVLAGIRPNGKNGWKIGGSLTTEGVTKDLSKTNVACGSLVFQDYALFDEFSYYENMAIAAHHAGASDEDVMALAKALLPEKIDLDDSVHEGSGGQQQRVAIARTLLSNRPILLLDEPNSGLDVTASRNLAQLIRKISRSTGKPAIIIAHHFHAFVEVADKIVLLDPNAKALRPLKPDASALERELEAFAEFNNIPEIPRMGVAKSGPFGPAGVNIRWLAKYFRHYLWVLCFAPSMILYMSLGGVLVGFVSTWFTFKYLPFAEYLTPLLHDDTLAGIGFVQCRILLPLVVSLLLAARNGAIIAADLGYRVNRKQIVAMQNLNIPYRVYIHFTILLTLVLSSVLMTAMSLGISAWVSMETWSALFPDSSLHIWRESFFSSFTAGEGMVPEGTWWVLAKVVGSAAAIGLASLVFGLAEKNSVVDINRGIAQAIVASVSMLLVIHTVVSLIEF
jgi:ABC-type lipoprotein export system ATPase subunit/ABC-type transporter Mla maintaining outer membrane lipid asymmetry permease subunit MlaE